MTDYLNPVYPHSFPDPFVLKFRGEYWAYCTGFWPDGRCFGILRSRDLVQWEPQAGALAPLAGSFPCYWAPEVTYDNGRFYLYYSVGDEATMAIRVAVADHPAGPFEDSGRRLTSEPFAIDAHVFAAADGSRYLFYATDFLEHSHIGTGTVMDRLLDPFTLAGSPRPVSRPRHDWHVYHPNRPEKGGVRWHTVEGSFVLERKGLYYQMFSGGNWQNPTYGVSYAVTDQLDRPGEWDQAADGVRVFPILRSGGEVIGPGHNSVVRGPDNRELFCVYHRWSADTQARVMAIDRLDWAGERLLVLGPSITPQPAPSQPAVLEIERPAGPDKTPYETGSASFLCEVTVRALEELQENAGVGIGFLDGGQERLRFLLTFEGARLVRAGRDELLPLPAGFDPRAFHLLRIDVDGRQVSIEVDGVALRWAGEMDGPAGAVALLSEGVAAEHAGFALTVGWEELFTGDRTAEARGWEIRGRDRGAEPGAARVTGGRLWLNAERAPAEASRGPELADSLLVVNARIQKEGIYSFAPALAAGGSGPRLVLTAVGEGWGLSLAESRLLILPEGFDPTVDQQFRFRSQGGRIAIEWEGKAVGEIEGPAGPSRIGLGAERGEVSFEAVRRTALPAS
jgi:GH43 family beta-xylosidase